MKFRMPKEIGILTVLFLVGLVFSVMSRNFLTLSNLFTLLLNAAVIAILSIGQTFVLLTGGIDLSVGSGIALSGVIAAVCLEGHYPLIVVILLSVASTTALGLFNGVIIHYTGIPPFITTFASMSIAGSIPMIITQAVPVAITRQSFGFIGGGFIGSIPVPVLILFFLGILAYIVLSRTVIGVHIYAVGGNTASARLAGVNTAKAIILVYLVSGLMSGFSGVIDASRLMCGFPTAGTGTSLFFSIAAAVVGGVSLFGGVGTIPGAIIGAVLIGTISDGLNIVDVNSYWQPLVVGLIILIGVMLDTLRASQRFNKSPLLMISNKLKWNVPEPLKK